MYAKIFPFREINKQIINETQKNNTNPDDSNPVDQASLTVPEGPSETKQEPAEVEIKSFSFALLGDSQYFKPGAGGNFKTAVGNIQKMKPDLVFGLGDLVSSCDGKSECEGKLNNWKNYFGALSSKVYPAQGNHDRTEREKADEVWQKVFAYLPNNGPQGYQKFTYSFDYENSHFVVLDSEKPNENDINGTQLSWLEGDLARNKKENIFVFYHEPAYPTNSKVGESLDASPKDRDALWNIFVKYKIKAVFSGHEHIQARSKIRGIYQFIFGNVETFNHLSPKPGTAEYSFVGPAFGIAEVKGNKLTVKTYSIQGKELNSFEF